MGWLGTYTAVTRPLDMYTELQYTANGMYPICKACLAGLQGAASFHAMQWSIYASCPGIIMMVALMWQVFR